MTIVIILLVIAVVVMFLYNGLVKNRNKVEESWSGIDVQLKRRYDLIPNLLETVKGYAAHEKGIFDNIANARAKAMSGGTVTDQANSENALTQSLRSLFAIAENYPDLKANTNFQQFQGELTNIEEQIQMARRYYNATVRDYNNSVETFPGVIIANAFNFGKKDYFEVEDAQKETPQVKF
ncbi:MAG: LemA family protein [Saprospiraceae bacterium]|nr:LemA family protein [Saprospiraceae bacterium]